MLVTNFFRKPISHLKRTEKKNCVSNAPRIKVKLCVTKVQKKTYLCNINSFLASFRLQNKLLFKPCTKTNEIKLGFRLCNLMPNPNCTYLWT